MYGVGTLCKSVAYPWLKGLLQWMDTASKPVIYDAKQKKHAALLMFSFGWTASTKCCFFKCIFNKAVLLCYNQTTLMTQQRRHLTHVPSPP